MSYLLRSVVIFEIYNMLRSSGRLAYLHEGLEPKVVHRDVKSSNILLDKLWNAKVSDFGLAKLICSQRSYVTTRVMGTFGWAPLIFLPTTIMKINIITVVSLVLSPRIGSINLHFKFISVMCATLRVEYFLLKFIDANICLQW